MSSFCWFLRTCGNSGFLSRVNPNIREIRSSSLLSLPPRFSKYYRKCWQAKLQVQMVLVFSCLKLPHQVLPNRFLGLIINRSISTRNFPSSKWKIATVTPVFKNQGSKNDKQNYNPILFFPILSKIFDTHLSRNTLVYCLLFCLP